MLSLCVEDKSTLQEALGPVLCGGRMCVCTQIHMSVCVLASKTNEKGA